MTDRMSHREVIDGWRPFTDEEIDRYVAGSFWRNRTVCDLSLIHI